MFDPARWRVSAIIPAYNRAQFLRETVSCLLAQRSPPHEVIVVDDGSTDATPDVAAEFGHAIKYVRTENCGAPAARNTGAALASGDWLWFCDSDDLCRPEYLDRCRRVAASAPYPEFLFGDFRLVTDGVWAPVAKFATAPAGFWESIERRPVDGGEIVAQPLYGSILRFQPIFPSTIVMTKAFFEGVGRFDESFGRTGSEDLEFILRCAGQAPLGIVDEPLVGIRRHEGNFSGDQLRTLLGEIEILRHAKTAHTAACCLGDQIEDEVARRTREALALAFSADDRRCVAMLAATLLPTQIDALSRAKVAISAMPVAVRMAIVTLARLANAVRVAPP